VALAVPTAVGFTAMAGQIIVMREVIVLFSGNELSVGIVLAAWLLWTSIGSGLTGRLMHGSAHVRGSIAAVECLCGLSLAPTIFILRSARAYLQIVPGESLGPVPMALVSLATLSVFCGLSGCLFALAVRLYRQTWALPGHLAVSYAYLIETVGSALGGILTSILLLRFFGSFQIAIIAALLNLYVACFLIFRMRRWQAATAIAATALALPMTMYMAPHLEETTQQKMWSGFQLIGSQDSIYGKLTILSARGLRSIYDNGSILANVPDVAAAEETVHYALLEHPAPKIVLLIGGGTNGSIAEALKHPTLARLDYFELDSALIGMYRKFFPAESSPVLSDARVHVHSMDGRLYLKATHERFDEIILSVPDPENAQLNRFYTAEFFASARDHLAPGGVFALQLRSSEDSIGPQLADFLRCIYHSLQGVFPSVAVIPGETIHMFGAVQSGLLTEDPHVLVARLHERRLQTLFVREYFIPFRMMPDRMEQIHTLLRPLVQTPTNRDFHPVAYYFSAILWSAQFKSTYARMLESVARVPFRTLLAGVAACSLVLLLLWMTISDKRGQRTAVWSVVATGYTLMTLQILMLLTFQSVYGYVYQELATLIGMFMAGIALGSWFGIARVRAGNGRSLLRAAAINQLLVALSAPLLLFLVSLLANASSSVSAMLTTRIAFPVLAVLCGIPGGYQFPIASAIYQQARPAQASISALYASDLVGGCAGALALAGFLIPVFGCWSTAWLTAAISITPAIILFLANQDSLAGSHEWVHVLRIPPR
jgi:spermidine synthase